jgi:malate synthase
MRNILFSEFSLFIIFRYIRDIQTHQRMNTAILNTPLGLVMNNDIQQNFPEILNDSAMDFIIALHEKFNHKRLSLLQQRVMSADLKTNQLKDKVDQLDWEINNIPKELLNASSSLKLSATAIDKYDPASIGAKQLIVRLEGKSYEENCQEHQAIFNFIKTTDVASAIYFEPRHIATEEADLNIHELNASAALYDFGLYFFNNAYELINLGKTPCFSISGISTSEEAKWWNHVFVFAQSYLGLPSGTLKVQIDLGAVLAIKNINAILFELKNHLAQISFSLRTYLESHVQIHFQSSKMTMPNLDQLSISSPFLTDVLDLIIHKSHGIGIPCIVDTHISKERKRSFQPDLKYLLERGFDGTFIIDQQEVLAINNLMLDRRNQLDNKRFDVSPASVDLVRTPTGTITEIGVHQCLSAFRKNIGGSLDSMVADQSLEGLVLRQWINHECKTVSGKMIDFNYCLAIR